MMQYAHPVYLKGFTFPGSLSILMDSYAAITDVPGLLTRVKI